MVRGGSVGRNAGQRVAGRAKVVPSSAPGVRTAVISVVPSGVSLSPPIEAARGAA